MILYNTSCVRYTGVGVGVGVVADKLAVCVTQRSSGLLLPASTAIVIDIIAITFDSDNLIFYS